MGIDRLRRRPGELLVHSGQTGFKQKLVRSLNSLDTRKPQFLYRPVLIQSVILFRFSYSASAGFRTGIKAFLWSQYSARGIPYLFIHKDHALIAPAAVSSPKNNACRMFAASSVIVTM
jgi:hypothetical protein